MSFAPIDPVDTLLPFESAAPDPDQELLDLTDDEGLPDAAVLEIEEDVRTTIGRSWSFDFVEGVFAPGPGGGPLETRGLATLRNWCEKALRTEGGGRYPIYSVDYGMIGVNREIGQPQGTTQLADLGSRIHDALTMHPRITDVVGFQSFIDPNDETLFVTFSVVTDLDQDLSFTDFQLI